MSEWTTTSHATRLGHVRETGVRQRGVKDFSRVVVVLLRSFRSTQTEPEERRGDVFVDNRRAATRAACALVDDGEPPVDGLHPDAERQGAREKEGRRHGDRKVRYEQSLLLLSVAELLA